jgi:hypothetical protein
VAIVVDSFTRQSRHKQEFATDSFDPLLAELSDETVGAVAPGISIMGKTPMPSIGYGQRWRDASLDVDWMEQAGFNTCQVPLLGRAFIAMRRELFAMVGGYDPYMIHWGAEDAELCIRLWTFGYECRVVPTIAVEHRFRPQHPYEVSWEAVLYNKLRLATLHFSPDRLGRVIQRLQQNPAFPEAHKRLGSTDAENRRKMLVDYPPLRRRVVLPEVYASYDAGALFYRVNCIGDPPQELPRFILGHIAGRQSLPRGVKHCTGCSPKPHESHSALRPAFCLFEGFLHLSRLAGHF